MRWRRSLLGVAGAAAFFTVSGQAAGDLNKRAEAVQEGDFVLIGNTLAQDCNAANTPAPTVGTLNCMDAGSVNDLPPDVFWQADANGAVANSTITDAEASSTAVLTLPEGATVTHAFMYWSGRRFTGPDNTAMLEFMKGGAAPLDAQALGSLTGGNNLYSAVADITDYVKANGAGAYRASGIETTALNGMAFDQYPYAVWWIVVLYKNPADPHRQLVIYDGFAPIENGGDSDVKVTGLLIPKNFASFSGAKVGVVGYDGDNTLIGDKFFLGDTALADASGKKDNFFNSTRSYLGSYVSVPGDLPQLKGTPGSMNRLDIDVIDVTAFLKEGQTEVDFKAVSEGEPVALAGIITSIPTFTDADGDGLSDDEEDLFGTDPNDQDSDNDGLPDGQEGCSTLQTCPNPGWNIDSDGDGLINALDPDADNDGLFDGTELGLDCSNPDTDKTLGHCIADADTKTTTDPLDADTDDGGVIDVSEDTNLNGKLDVGEGITETDPTSGHGDDDGTVIDSDGDGLSDGLEDTIGSDKNDQDSDNDGVPDGEEPNPADDTDGDGLPTVLDVDSDNDGLFDGTETGKDCSNPDTDVALGHCIADADPSTTTSPLDADTDDGGVSDGSEDTNLDGKLDSGETDPTKGHPTDDGTVTDQDGDGLSDDLEINLGSNPLDKDSDDDGVPDGREANPANDEDGDGNHNILDEDSDGDGLFDGTEGGYPCSDPSTDKSANHCIPDGDKGKTTTSMVDADSDNGGVTDGEEDFDKDGQLDTNQGEGNPNDPADDIDIVICEEDHPACGPENNGKVCNLEIKHCVDGCKDVDGSRCPDNQACILAEGETIGYCSDSSATTGGTSEPFVVYDGCICMLGSNRNERGAAWALFAAGTACAIVRRRARPRRV